MPDQMDRVGIIAEVATAIAAVTYPIVRVVSGHLERRRQRRARELKAAAVAVEARLIERLAVIESRITWLEEQ